MDYIRESLYCKTFTKLWGSRKETCFLPLLKKIQDGLVSGETERPKK